MANDHPEELNTDKNDFKHDDSNSGLEDSDVNLFESVWVKIEVDDDNEIQIKNDEEEENIGKHLLETKKSRKPCKRWTPQQKHLKCDHCDYQTGYKHCLAIHVLSHTEKKPYTCNECDYKTKYSTAMKRHVHMKHGSNTLSHKCNLCEYTTNYKWNLNLHMRKHDLAKQFKCPECDYSTAYKHNVIKHSRKHAPVRRKELSFNCDKCPFVTKYEGHILRHQVKVHLEVSEKVSCCEHCTFVSKARWMLNKHKKKSLRNETIKCIYCDYETMYQCAFKEHKTTHSDESKKWLEILPDRENGIPNLELICEVRQTKSDVKNFENLQQTEHEKNNHYLLDATCEVEWRAIQVLESSNPERPFRCTNCEYTAKFKAAVQRHYQRNHNDNRPYKCLNCDFATKTKDQIAVHSKRSQSLEAQTCKICGFTTLFKCQFALHEKEHKPFKCVRCEYTSSKKIDVGKHFRMVHLKKEMQCKLCSFKTKRKENMLSHEAIHTGHNRFQCKYCSYNPARKFLLENHMKRIHKTKMNEVIDDPKIESLKKKTEEVVFTDNASDSVVTE